MRYAPTLSAIFIFAIFACACSDNTAIHLSCAMVVTMPNVGTSHREAIISIAPDHQNATLVWLPKKPDVSGWRIRGNLDERFFTGVVDGDLKIQVSIDRNTGELLVTDSIKPIRRYVGTCEPSKQVFEPKLRIGVRPHAKAESSNDVPCWKAVRAVVDSILEVFGAHHARVRHEQPSPGGAHGI